jgi:lysophospholipase L1-like esterase
MTSPPRPTEPAETRPEHPVPADGRVRAPWTRVLFLAVCAFAVWFVLFAPTLQHNAQVSPVGHRRTISLDITGPVAALSRGLQLSRIVSATGREDQKPGGTVGLIESGPKPPPPPRRTTQPGAGGGTSGDLPPPTTVPPNPKHPTSADPLRVLIVGDSIGIDMGGPLQYDLAGTGVVNAALDGRVSTGLTRPDYFNWPVELASDLKTVSPQVVVIMMGANDAQDFLGPPDVPYTSPQWNPMYAQKVDQFMAEAGSSGALVIWVGMPPMQNPALSAQMADLDTIDQQEAAVQKPPAVYLSTDKSLGTAQGGYTAFVTTASGQVVNVRTPDGTHLTPGGGQVVAQQVINELVSLGYKV